MRKWRKCLRKPPPHKKNGQAQKPRRFNGILMDVRGLASYLGTSEHCVRSRVRRREIPFKKMGGRLLFLKHEIDQYLEQLPGCDLEEAVQNLEARHQ